MSDTKRKIIIVDDDLDNTELFTLFLEQEGYQVAAASNGKVGLEKIEAAPPDLIICDVVMPEMDGFAVCARLRDSQHRDIPIILMTGLDAGNENTGFPADAISKANADEYLEKPVDPKTLIMTVARLLK